MANMLPLATYHLCTFVNLYKQTPKNDKYVHSNFVFLNVPLQLIALSIYISLALLQELNESYHFYQFKCNRSKWMKWYWNPSSIQRLIIVISRFCLFIFIPFCVLCSISIILIFQRSHIFANSLSQSVFENIQSSKF